MTAYRTITVNCDQCGKGIVTDDFESIPEARRTAKGMGLMVVRVVKNGSRWDFCTSCAKNWKR